MSESQKINRQKALTTASGSIWLVVAAVISALCLVMLWTMRELPPLGAATTGFVLVIVGYLAMVAVRLGVPHVRTRLIALAVLTVAIVLAFMTVGGIIIV